jgi:peptidyl-prolyl cis-trans isomerase A (cyclophilin A)
MTLRWLLQSCVTVGSLALVGGSLAIVGCADERAAKSQDPEIPRVDASGSAPRGAQSSDKSWVKLETTKGDVIIEVVRDWSPHGADRFLELVKSGFYNDCRFFRVMKGFMAQVGISGQPELSAKWMEKNIPDDHPSAADRQSNLRGYVTFAKSGRPNSRSTQFFINYRDNSRLDEMGFTPFGRVISGMSAVDSIYNGYNEEPQQDRIASQGNAYLDKSFPKLDSIKKATILPKEPELPKPKAE